MPRSERPARVTLKDVAAHAGVSVGTVSDIVNRGLSDNYAEPTRQRVHRSIDQLGYRPTRAAQNLKRGRTDTIGIALTRGFDNPYYARLFDTIKRALGRYQLSSELMVLDNQQRGEARRVCDGMISHGVEGLIVGPVYYWDKPILEELRDQKRVGVPTVTFGAVRDEVGMHNVFMGDDQGGVVLTEYLLSMGHRRIAYFPIHPPDKAHLDRGSLQEGVTRVLEARGLFDEDWVFLGFDLGRFKDSFEYAQAFAHRWLDARETDRPTAVICKTDQIAITALAVFHRLGIRVPEDLSVIGYDNLPESAYTIPALTTVDNAIDQRMAQVAEDIATMVGRTPVEPAPRQAVIPKVIERDSVKAITPG